MLRFVLAVLILLSPGLVCALPAVAQPAADCTWKGLIEEAATKVLQLRKDRVHLAELKQWSTEVDAWVARLGASESDQDETLHARVLRPKLSGRVEHQEWLRGLSDAYDGLYDPWASILSEEAEDEPPRSFASRLSEAVRSTEQVLTLRFKAFGQTGPFDEGELNRCPVLVASDPSMAEAAQLEAEWDLWSKFFRGDKKFGSGSFWHPVKSKKMSTATIVDHVRTQLLLTPHNTLRTLEADDVRAFERWILNEQHAARSGSLDDVLRLLKEMMANTRWGPHARFTRYHRALWRRLSDVGATPDPQVSPDRAGDGEEWQRQWLVNLEREGDPEGDGYLSRALGLPPSSGWPRCTETWRDLIDTDAPAEGCLEANVALVVGKRFASFTKRVFVAPECIPDQVVREDAPVRLLFFEHCRDLLEQTTSVSLQLANAFTVGFRALGHSMTAHNIARETLERFRKAGVVTHQEQQAQLALENATALLALGRPQLALAAVRRTQPFLRQRALDVRGKELAGNALRDLGDLPRAATSYLAASRLISGSDPESRRERWQLRAAAGLAQAQYVRQSTDAKAISRSQRQLAKLLREGATIQRNTWTFQQSALLAAVARQEEDLGSWSLAARHYHEAFERLRTFGASGSDSKHYAATYAQFLARRGRTREAATFALSLIDPEDRARTCREPSVAARASWLRLASIAVSDALVRRSRLPVSFDALLDCLAGSLGAARSARETTDLQQSLDSLNSVAADVMLRDDPGSKHRTEAYTLLHALKAMVERREAHLTATVLSGYESALTPMQKVAPDFGSKQTVEELHYFSFDGQNPRTRKHEQRLLLVHASPRGAGAHYKAYDLGALRGIETLVQRARARVENRNSRPLGVLGKMYRRLIPEGVRFLSQTRAVRVNATGALQTLPFGALYDGRRFLAQRFQVQYMVESTVAEPGDAGSENRVLILGSPAFLENGYYFPERDGSFIREDLWRTLPRLRGARKEMSEVQIALPGFRVTVLTGAEATEANLRGALHNSHRILHLATHGVARSRSKAATYDGDIEQVALALSRAPHSARDSSDDGWLTENEVATLNLKRTELVVLAACETGLGTARVGAQLAGLRRALLLGAGAHSVVSSLWKISDAASAEFMRHFYEQLALRRSRADALDEASRRLRLKYQHPYFWAAFQLHGETSPIGSH